MLIRYSNEQKYVHLNNYLKKTVTIQVTRLKNKDDLYTNFLRDCYLPAFSFYYFVSFLHINDNKKVTTRGKLNEEIRNIKR